MKLKTRKAYGLTWPIAVASVKDFFLKLFYVLLAYAEQWIELTEMIGQGEVVVELVKTG